MSSSYLNPILPGFFPDPSCIRVDDTFYMINSSFQFFPGLPIHISKDLVNWKLVGHAICRPDQLSLEYATTKINNAERKEIFTAGLYAPVVRWHNGVFYIVCTNLSGTTHTASDEDFRPHNFLVTSSDLKNPGSFSIVMPFDFHGIDPSLFFDDDGEVYMQGSFIHGYRKKPATVIRQAAFDVHTGTLKGEAIDIWTGSGDKVPEGPHVYKKDGLYWLLIAEGGTHHGHKITMARSRSVWGPFEACEQNPLLTGMESSIIQCVGHGELFDDVHGSWWVCMLARREFGSAYPLGRETFMVPVSWPKAVFPKMEPVELIQVLDDRPELPARHAQTAAEAVVLLTSQRTLYLRTPQLQNYAQTEDGHGIILSCTETPLGAGSGSPTFVGVRQTSLISTAETILDLSSLPETCCCGLSLYKDTYRHVSFEIDSAREFLRVAAIYPGQDLEHLQPISLGRATAVKLIIVSSVEHYLFSVSTFVNKQWSSQEVLFQCLAASLSGDDFTGTVYGIYACGSSGTVKFDSFEVR
ncbi:beta-xylosidase [Boeremia exigua]|uniref:beta-xylosidase n=1 Tax=Boeremia exigua TaxID=749465 RepID=UPI001E8E45A8|nr:beta-xylosidase [Boeremia exigua]KAH6613001.1 beta-xylosidase [Boeremia exigua]